MLLYDFEKIWLLSGGRSDLIVRYFKGLYYQRPELASLRGSNFMVNPKVVVENTRHLSDRTLAEYIGLCALRNYANYKMFSDCNLEIEYFPDYIPSIVVDSNPLIQKSGTKLIFKEELI